MIRRPPRSTQSRSSAASDVYKRQRQIRTLRNCIDAEAERTLIGYTLMAAANAASESRTWSGQLLLREGNRICGRRIVRNCRGSFAVVLQGFVLLAQFFVGLADHALDEWIVLVCLIQSFNRRFVI